MLWPDWLAIPSRVLPSASHLPVVGRWSTPRPKCLRRAGVESGRRGGTAATGIGTKTPWRCRRYAVRRCCRRGPRMPRKRTWRCCPARGCCKKACIFRTSNSNRDMFPFSISRQTIASFVSMIRSLSNFVWSEIRWLAVTASVESSSRRLASTVPSKLLRSASCLPSSPVSSSSSIFSSAWHRTSLTRLGKRAVSSATSRSVVLRTNRPISTPLLVGTLARIAISGGCVRRSPARG